MSRTYRTHLESGYQFKGDWYWWWDPYIDLLEHRFRWSLTSRYKLFRTGRDKKPWNKPAKFFKQLNRRSERAQEKQAIREEKELPRFKKRDQWDWT